jgi:PAS domain S-box-containing protein
VRYLLLIIRDETESVRVTRSLRESETKFSAIFHESLEPLVFSDAETSIVLDANQAFFDLIGREGEEVLGQSAIDLGIWSDVKERWGIVAKVKAEGAANRVEVHVMDSAGKIHLCLVSCQSIEMNGKNRLVWGMHDITEERALDEKIQALNVTLERKVRERTGELEAANLELRTVLATLQRAKDDLVRSEKMAALGGLVAGVAHELNTPIGNSVTLASDLELRAEGVLLKLRDSELKRSELEQFLEYSISSDTLLMHCLSQADELITNFKQVAVDRSSDLRRSFSLSSLVRETVATFRSTLARNPCAISVETEIEGDIEMEGYPGSISQVLGNFINNSAFHGFEGREHGLIRIVAHKKEDGVELIYEDDGVGVAPENIKNMFEPFFTTKFGQGGSGLGLYIVYNVVTNLWGGKITVESPGRHGARFTLHLPLRASEGESNPYRPA